ncbi:MAG: hypothetical protein KAQ66_06445 [Rhodospirillaceae bacterium]|nr:hypothetical protein [Rhodospirillaceae bacterium]MCK5546002.1 hypothetical protein [Rhodospirillaceae bacterium]
MNEQPQNNAEFFFGVMVLKGGKWVPHSKFDGGAFGTALISAEETDSLPEFDGVKIMRFAISKSSGAEPKEMWVSPRFEARAKAAASAKVRTGLKQTQETIEAARRSNFKKTQ